MYALAAFLLLCVDIMVMSYAYEVSCCSGDSYAMSNVYMLKSVGERMLP